MKNNLLIILILLCSIGFSQSKTDCSKLLNQKFNFNLSTKKEIGTVKENLSELNNCGIGHIDDESISNISILISMIEPMIQKKKDDVSYRDIYDSIIMIQQYPDYNKIVDAVKASNELSTRKVNLDNWDEDKKLFQKLEFSKKTNEGYFKYLKENIDTTKTYKEIYEDYEKNQLLANFNNEPDNHKLLYKNSGVIDFSKLITKAKKANKPILIYFNGYACVNARRMEENILEEDIIINLILNNFVFENVYVDDQTKLPEDEWIVIEETGKLINKVGMKNHKFQVEKFKSNLCPFFVITDKFGNKIRSQQYTTDINEFKDFLLLTDE